MRLALPAGVLCAALCCAPRPAAGEEGELLLSLSPVYAVIDWDARQPSGGGATLEVAWGLTESVWLRGTGFYSVHPVDADEAAQLPSGAMQVGGAFAGITYAFDVLRIIPYVDVGLGAIYARGAGQEPKLDLGFALGLGADYLYTRRVSFGIFVRYHSFVTNITSIPVYLYAGPRVSLRWD